MIENTKEKEKQIDIINKLKNNKKLQGKKFFVETFGCQMNAHDSEKFIGILKEIGYEEAPDIKSANLILLNTWCVRDNAERKVYGRIGLVKRLRELNPDRIFAIAGCMMQQETVLKDIRTKYRKIVNIVFGTHNIYKFPEMLEKYLEDGEQIIDIWDEYKDIVEDLPSERKYEHRACVNIMYGCNNFCSYCIVPYVRGRERSRDASEIIKEVERLTESGVTEVMLLGQNVNSYGRGNNDDITFPKLLTMVSEVPGIKKISFMTPHPKDCSDELIEVVKNNPKVYKHMHLPVQSGSTKVLKDMNRIYTKEEYLELIKKVKKEIPDVIISSDMIVGFPTETEEDFLETLEVVKEVRYDTVYSFIFSKRTGTKAATFKPVATEEEVSKRFDTMLKLITDIQTENNAKRLGKVYEVHIDEEKTPGNLAGRVEGCILVHISGSSNLVGQYVKVKITETKGHYLTGELVK